MIDGPVDGNSVGDNSVNGDPASDNPVTGGQVDGSPVAILANPTAGRGRYARAAHEVAEVLEKAGLRTRLLEPGDPQAALDDCHTAVADGVSALVAVGGDGTAHLALQAVAGRPTPMGLIPIGTGNDFAVALDLPAGVLPAAEALAAALINGNSRRVDLAELTTPGQPPCWYGAVMSAGLDASINERANRMRWPTGPRRYDISTFIEMVTLAPREYTLTLDGQTIETSALIIAVGNTAHYGGGMRICPAATPTDGLLDVTVIGPIGRATAVRMKSLVRRGDHIKHPAVRTYRAAHVTIDGPALTTYADGERALALPVGVRCVHDALTVLG